MVNMKILDLPLKAKWYEMIESGNKIQAEKSVGHSFFPPSYIPQRFCKNKQYPYIEEVLEYVKEHTLDMFEPEGGYACMSLFHGLCE